MPFEQPREMSWSDVRTAVKIGDPACILEVCRVLLAQCPDHGPTLLCMGTALTDLARYDEAEALLEKAHEHCPPKGRLYVEWQVGHLHMKRGEHAEAESWYRRALSCQQERGLGHVHLGACLARQGRLTEALDCHRQAIACDAEDVDEASYHLGLVLRAQGLYKEAKECFERVIESDPAYTDAMEALQDIVRAIEFKPT